MTDEKNDGAHAGAADEMLRTLRIVNEKKAAMLSAIADYNAARRGVEERCKHRRATKRQTQWALEVSCIDCGQIWTLSFSSYHGSEGGTPSLENRWREFIDQFVSCSWVDP